MTICLHLINKLVLLARSRISFCCSSFIVLICALVPVCVNANNFSEQEIKAAYIYNFLHFIEWNSKDISSLNICLYGPDENVVNSFKSMPKKTKAGRDVNVIFYNVIKTSADINLCHVVFINKAGTSETKKILAKVESNEIMTIGESDGFVKQGGMIGFVIENEKVSFDVSMVAVKKASLNISSQILRLANKVFKDESNE
jgi:YfiR/HmsC-like